MARDAREEARKQAVAKPVQERVDHAEAGRAEYVRYCSACHGEEADGNGPVANVLSPRPPALTSLRKKFGKPLSTDLVAFVSGTSMPRAHGTSDMPVWGKVLREETGDERTGVDLLWQIVHYLDCIQTKE